MSTEGGLSNEEYGGAHEKHDTGLDVNNTCVTDCNFIKTGEFANDNNTVQILSFQDGDIIDKGIDTDNVSVPSFLSGELDSFHSNTQRVENDSVNFEIPSSSEDDCDLFSGSGGGLSGSDASILCSDVTGTQMCMSPTSQGVFNATEANLVESTIGVSPIVSTESIELIGTAGLELQTILQQVPNDTESLLSQSSSETDNDIMKQDKIAPASCGPIVSNQLCEPTILLAPPANVTPQYIQATAIPQTIQVIPPSSGLSQNNHKFGTISISTDKPSKSTHILVNTSQGNQLYKINTDDLQQASNSLSPTTDVTSQPNTLQTGNNTCSWE